MKIDVIADKIVKELKSKIKKMPNGFFDSFDFTQTGNNLTHPYTWGILTEILWQLDGTTNVGIDVRFNIGNGIKFQPDLVAFNSKSQPIVCVDYESPNSSDARIPTKDIDSFISWQQQSFDKKVLYIIVTTLPNYEAPKWELRYSSSNGCNYSFRDCRDKIRANPCSFWYDFYNKECMSRDMKGIAMLNISGKDVQCLISE